MVLTILLAALGGLLIGGAISLRRQGAGWVAVVPMVVLAALAVAGALAWM